MGGPTVEWNAQLLLFCVKKVLAMSLGLTKNINKFKSLDWGDRVTIFASSSTHVHSSVRASMTWLEQSGRN